ncbi:MAG: DNA repair protein Rad52 [Gammaproteobacteria bacterium]|nr:DNA repair protein Rad52 [Gammaproteobacteria bacterium]
MFNDKQTQVLAYELDNSRIKSRSKGAITLLYLEGHDILDAANRIFGYGNWSYNISTLEQVSQEMNQNENVVICYKAVITITVYDLQHSKQTNRQDVGFGTGIAKTLADAHESAAKEAVTDAIKRAMRSFGNQFGNSLYDKSRNQPSHQNGQATYQQPAQSQQYQQPQMQQIQNNTPQDYTSLYNLELTIMEQGHNLVVIGDDIFAKKDSIKACGFRWDTSSKMWYKPIEQQAA